MSIRILNSSLRTMRSQGPEPKKKKGDDKTAKPEPQIIEKPVSNKGTPHSRKPIRLKSEHEKAMGSLVQKTLSLSLEEALQGKHHMTPVSFNNMTHAMEEQGLDKLFTARQDGNYDVTIQRKT